MNAQAKLLIEAGVKFVNGPYTVNPFRLFWGTLLMKISAKLLNCKIELVLTDPLTKQELHTSTGTEEPIQPSQFVQRTAIVQPTKNWYGPVTLTPNRTAIIKTEPTPTTNPAGRHSSKTKAKAKRG